MSLLHEAIDQKKFDTRMLDKNLQRNVITDKEVKTIEESLPDDAENADYISLEVLADPNTKV
jgi:hypothetical protein